MILYFANRKMDILGQATTTLQKGFVITEDLKTEEIETGVSTFSCRIGFDKDTRFDLEDMTEAGNYLLRSHNNENEFYTIIDSEIDTKNQEIYIYAEDAGLDLINEIVGEFEATTNYNAEWYINKYLVDSGFEIGINEIPSSTKKQLSWSGESSVTERLASIATEFGGYEISYSFKIKGLAITNKYVNIYKERGKDTGETLYLNRDIDNIITSKSVANLATAFVCEGGTPEGADNPITLKGYKYDDGDFYVGTDGILRSRKAVEKWSRYVNNKEPNQLSGYAGHIMKPYFYDTTSKATLCSYAVAELKKVCDMEVNYEIDLKKLPDSVEIGDRINIVDDAGELYFSSRVLKLETSVVDQDYTVTLGEHLIKSSGISQKVLDLAAQFASNSQTAQRALAAATTAKTAAEEAQTQANTAVGEAEKATQAANEATTAANTATESAAQAKTAADNAQTAVDNVGKSVEELETTVTNAQTAAANAQQAATTAQTKATEAEQAAAQAKADAADAKAAVEVAEGKAETAIVKAETAQNTAETAKTEATIAKETAQAAKLDAKKAEEDIASLGERLTTVTTTMEADYARKTDLTESEAHLQSQISQNAGLISSTVSMLSIIDETTNDAQDQAEKAQKRAQAAREQANQATADASAAQNAADEAQAAADSAQAEADIANAAADAAQAIVDQAEAELTSAKAELDEVLSRADATEAEIAAAQEAVNSAQAAADKAKADAEAAIKTATEAQNEANTAVNIATEAQAAANTAASYAKIAQSLANEAENASAAQDTADEAAQAAATAKATADTAKSNAESAQARAEQAVADAIKADNEAKAAAQSVANAQANLNTAKQNLADVLANVDATQEDIAEAQAALEAAQNAADEAMQNAAEANGAAELAAQLAAVAQGRADEAKEKADAAQKAADDAQAVADEAKAAAESLAVRVTSAETKITQNAEQIELRATKTEVETNYKKLWSQGQQLIINGNGIMGDNTNFPTLVYDGAVANNSPGSFTIRSGMIRDVAGTEEFVAVDPTKEYTFSIDLKSLNGQGTFYSYLNNLDADLNIIQHTQTHYREGSTTKLVKDLVAGDTVVYVEDLSGWSYSHLHSNFLSVWDYTNSFGYTYPAETYTRNVIRLSVTNYYPTDGIFDFENNTITLDAPYSGVTHYAGTSVSQAYDGGTYNYIAATGHVIPAKWTTYTGIMHPAGTVGSLTSFPYGTAYVKPGFLWNWNSADDRIWATNITLSETTAVNALERRVTDAETAIIQNADAIYLRATKTEVKQAVDDIEVGGRNLYVVRNAEEGYLTGSTTLGAMDAMRQEHTSEFIPVKEGENYVLQVWATVDTTDTEPVTWLAYQYYNADKALLYGRVAKRGSNILTNGKWYDSYYITAPAAAAFIRVSARLYSDGQIKFEKGNKATDWLPAPEDVAEDISVVEGTAAQNASDIASALAEISVLADSVVTLVTDETGASILTQNKDGWTFSTAEIQSAVNSVSEGLGALTNSLGSTDAAVDVLKEAVNDIGRKADYVNIKPYTYTNDEGATVTEPCIELGESDSDYKLLITNTQILFKVGSAAPTRIKTDGLITDNITVENEFRQTNESAKPKGVWIWAVRTNGNYGLQWKGAN